MKKLHQDVENYVRLMRMLTFWFGEDEYLDKSIFGGFLKVYLKIKWALSIGIFVATSICVLYLDDNFGLYDGTIGFVVTSFLTANIATICTFFGKEHLVLTTSLSDQYHSHSEQWIVDVRSKLNTILYKWATIIIAAQVLAIFGYITLPLLAEIISHHGFDLLDAHIFCPYPFSPVFKFLDLQSVWDVKYYLLSLANIYAIAEMTTAFCGFFCSYGFVTIFFIAEIRSLKEAIKSVDSTVPEIEREGKIKEIVEWHCNVLKLNNKIKAYFGLPCAFITVFASAQLSLSSFSIATSSNMEVVIPHGLGMFIILANTAFINVLGQKLENEGEEIYEAFCNWPWYKWGPRLKKTINMMLRQGQTPINIDYYGKAKMNNDNLMQILQTSYSYFTLVYSMATR